MTYMRAYSKKPEEQNNRPRAHRSTRDNQTHMYVMTIVEHTGIFKVGRTEDVAQRRKTATKVSVPYKSGGRYLRLHRPPRVANTRLALALPCQVG